jgi:hypothetical protein
MLLCDAAQEIGGKLYILGGGWSVRPVQPVAQMAIAIKISIGWHEANAPVAFELRLMTQDGEPVNPGAGPVVIQGQLEVGRPPGLPAGTDLDSALALNVGFPLGAGGYRWELDLANQRVAQEPFIVMAPPVANR